MGGGHLASASYFNFEQLGARGSASRGVFCLYLLLIANAGVIPPFDRFPSIKKQEGNPSRFFGYPSFPEDPLLSRFKGDLGKS